MSRHVKYLLLIIVVISSCKDEILVSDNHPSNIFDKDGKQFEWNQFNAQTWPTVSVSILPNSVEQRNYLEYSTFLLDQAYPLDSFEINFGRRDINYFQSSVSFLQLNASVSIPFPSSVNYSMVAGYLIYKIELNGTDSLWQQINNPQNRTPISVFSIDTVADQVTFETDDLNAVYVIGKEF